jgi:peroxiredoxin
MKHLPSYVIDHEKLKDGGFETVACLSVNDRFVMSEWGKAQGTDGKVVMLADEDGSFTKSLGMAFTALGGTRSKRYALVLQDGLVTHTFIDESGIEKTLASNVLQMSKPNAP